MTLSFLDVARDLALQAAACLMDLRKSPLVRERKADHSLVTNADHAADRILREGLRKAFPSHAVITEESRIEGPSDADYVWLVDPLDGTAAYAKGAPGFSVMLGLLRREELVAGIVVDPLEGHVYEAMKGEGAFHTLNGLNGTRRRVHVSNRRDLPSMPVITSVGFPPTVEKSLRPALPGPWLPTINSVGIKVGYVVRELADIYINHHAVHYWDTCAPQIILEEAGGTLTFLNGDPLRYVLSPGRYRHPAATLATNGPRHEDVLSILRAATPPLV